jgi:tetratricopeptide (TPR) repeat protein
VEEDHGPVTEDRAEGVPPAATAPLVVEERAKVLARASAERGHASMWKGDYEQAITDYTDALRLDPQAAEVCYGRGLAYYHQGAFTQAITDYASALQLKPGYALASNGRGLAYVAQGEREQAIADFTGALRADASCAEAYNNRGCVYCQQGNWDKAAADFARAVQLDGKNPAYARNQAFASARKASPVVLKGVPAPSTFMQREK